MTIKTQPYKIYRVQQKQVLEVHSNIGLLQGTRKTSNKQPNLPPKRIRKKEQNLKSAEGWT